MPAAGYKVDMQKLRVIASYMLHGEPYESVYGLCLLPDAFQDPPSCLAGA